MLASRDITERVDHVAQRRERLVDVACLSIHTQWCRRTPHCIARQNRTSQHNPIRHRQPSNGSRWISCVVARSCSADASTASSKRTSRSRAPAAPVFFWRSEPAKSTNENRAVRILRSPVTSTSSLSMVTVKTLPHTAPSPTPPDTFPQESEVRPLSMRRWNSPYPTALRGVPLPHTCIPMTA